MQIALIGAPNVGKSSLVTVLSSGTPEICNYPFTTRSVKMGHFYVNQIRHQVRPTTLQLAMPVKCRQRGENFVKVVRLARHCAANACREHR